MADENIVTNITATSNFSDLIGDVNRVAASLAKLQQQLITTDKAFTTQVSKINATFAGALSSSGQFSTHFVTLASDAEKFGKSLDSGKLKLRDYYNTLNTHAKTSGGLIRDLAKQQTALQQAVIQPLGKNAEGMMRYNIHVARGLDEVANKTRIARMEAGIMNKVIQQGAGQLINWGKNTQWAGRQLTVGLTLPIVAFGKAAADAFAQADAELVRLTKVYGDLAGTSSAELGAIRREVSATAAELARSYGAAYKETISLAADIAATGQTGEQLIASTRETTRLAILGEVDRQDAMKATLAIQSAFKQNTTELTESINFLNAVENQTSTSLADLVEAIPKAGPVIKGLGGDVKDLALYLTAMREGGINASEGANAIKSSLASLINPTKVATDQFNSLGIDLKGIVTRNAGNLTQTLLDLQVALDKLNPLQKQQALEQLFGKFQFARMNALFSNLGKQGSQTLQVLDLMKASSEDLANVASRELSQVTESASGRYRRAIEGLKADLASVGETFLGISTNLVNFVDKIVNLVGKLPDPVKKILAGFAALTALSGPLIMLTGLLANFFGYIIKGVAHFRALFKGAEGWKLLTPEIVAANNAANLIEKTFYSDAKAALVLKDALAGLINEFTILQAKAQTGAISVAPTLSTMAGNVVIPGGGLGREVNPQHPLLSAKDTRSMSHMNPVAGMTPEQRAAQTLFGVVPGAPRINNKIKNNPQIYMQGDLPKIPGLTSARGISTGVVSEEAAKWHSMTGALAMQSQEEIELLKREVAATGFITSELSGSYQALLPQITKITSGAAQESAAIVNQLQAGKITLDQARAKIVALNAQIESMIAQTVTATAQAQGRTANLSMIPLTDQPPVDPKTGKSNMKEWFRPRNRSLITRIAQGLGVKTYGAPYSTETTRPKRFNTGGKVFYNDGDQVPGPNVNADVVPAMLTPGEFVIRKDVAQQDPEGMRMLNNGQAAIVPIQGKNLGGVIARLLPNMVRKLPRGFIPEGSSKVFARAFFDTKTGGNVTKQREWLNDSMTMFGRLYPNGSGGFYKPSDISRMSDREIRRLWKGIEKGHFAGKRNIEGTDNYFVPGAMGPQSSSANKKAISGGSPAAFADDLENVPIHPMVIMRSAAQSLGYNGNPDQFIKAYNSLITALRGRAKSKSPNFGPGDTFEMFAEKVLAKHLNRVSGKTDSKFFNEILSYGTVRGKQEGRSVTASGEKKSGTGSLYTARIVEGFNKGGLIGQLGMRMYKGLYKSPLKMNPEYQDLLDKQALGVWDRLPKDELGRVWHQPNMLQAIREGRVNLGKYPKPKNYYQDMTNDDPAHGALQIGRYRDSLTVRGRHIAPRIEYNAKAGSNWMQKDSSTAFEIGDLETRARSALFNYMKGDYKAIDDPAVQSYLSTLRTKFTGTLHRGVRDPNSLPPVISDLIRQGRWSELVGKEFIMRRSSWSTNRDTATGFGDLQMIANVKNRNAVPASEIFPDMTFPSIHGPVKVNENEVYMGGKFRVVAASKNKLRLQAVVDGKREMGGPVSAGKSYLVGEKGPELFVPGNSGSIIPGYNKGGKILNAIGGFGSIASGIGGSMLGGKYFGEMGSLVGMFAGPMIINRIMALVKSFGAVVKAGGGARVVLQGLAKVALGNPYTALALAVSGAGVALFKMWDNARKARIASQEALKVNSKEAKELGISYTNLGDTLSNALTKARKERELLLAKSATANQVGGGLFMTVKELDALQKKAKETQGSVVEMFNNMNSSDVVAAATALKVQLVAAGKSASDAAKEIFGIISVSNKASQAVAAISSKSFMAIVDKTTAAKQAIANFDQAVLAGADKKELAAAFESSMDSISSYYKSLVGTKDETGKLITETDALALTMDKIKELGADRKTISEETYNTLIKENPALRSILSSSDSLGDSWAKIQLYTKGVTGDLRKLSGDAAKNLLTVMTAMEESSKDMVTNVNLANNSLHQLAVAGATLKAQADADKAAADKAAKAAQRNGDAEIKAIDKKIKKIQEAADARRKALEDEADQESFLVQIQKEKVKYADALASGNMSEAAQAQLNIRQLTIEDQKKRAMAAIDAKEKEEVNALEEKKLKVQESIAAAQKKAAAAAEKAAASAEKYAKIQMLQNSIAATITQAGRYEKGSKEFDALSQALKSDVAALAQLGPEGARAAKSMTPAYSAQSGIAPGAGPKQDWAGQLATLTAENNKNAEKYFKQFGGDVATFGTWVAKLKDIPAFSKDVTKDYGNINFNRFDPRTWANTDNLAKLIRGEKLKQGDSFTYKGKEYTVKNTSGVPTVEEVKYAMGGYVKHFEPGGRVSGPGTGTSDSIPAMLSNGEYVIRASAVQAIGTPMLDSINKMAMGGLATTYNIPTKSLAVNAPMGYNRGGSVHHYEVGGLVINTQPGQSEMEIARLAVGMMNAQSALGAKKLGEGRLIV